MIRDYVIAGTIGLASLVGCVPESVKQETRIEQEETKLNSKLEKNLEFVLRKIKENNSYITRSAGVEAITHIDGMAALDETKEYNDIHSEALAILGLWELAHKRYDTAFNFFDRKITYDIFFDKANRTTVDTMLINSKIAGIKEQYDTAIKLQRNARNLEYRLEKRKSGLILK